MQRAHILISGMVQGVGFRNFVLRYAKELGVNGVVRNSGDFVEVVAEGSLEKLNHLISICKEGPTFAKVEHVDVKFDIEKKPEYSDFWVE